MVAIYPHLLSNLPPCVGLQELVTCVTTPSVCPQSVFTLSHLPTSNPQNTSRFPSPNSCYDKTKQKTACQLVLTTYTLKTVNTRYLVLYGNHGYKHCDLSNFSCEIISAGIIYRELILQLLTLIYKGFPTLLLASRPGTRLVCSCEKPV